MSVIRKSLLCLGLCGIPPLAVARGAVAQRSPALDMAINEVRRAWLAHDLEGLLARADTVRLQLGDMSWGPGVRRQQTIRVLQHYLRETVEVSFELVSVRSVTADFAFTEFGRRYVVPGTEDERVETVFIGMGLRGGAWSVLELRIVP